MGFLKATTALKKEIGSADSLRKYAVLLALFLICVIMAFASPAFMTSSNLLGIVRQVTVFGLLAIGQTLVVITGEIDLSVGSIVAISGVVAALTEHAGYGVAASIIFPLAVGAAIGLLTGTLVAKGNVPSFVVTLGMMGIARGAALVLTEGYPISGFSKPFRFIGGGELFHIPVPMILLLGITVVIHIVLSRTAFGRHLYAIGGSRKAALYSGIKINRTIIMAFVLSGVSAAFGGVMLTSRLNAAETVAGEGYELTAIAAVVIGGASLKGGKGHVLGTLLGTIFLGVITNSLTMLAVPSYWQRIVQGAIIILAVLLNSLQSDGKKKK